MAVIFVQAIAQHTKEGFTFSHTHKTKRKRSIKIINPKNNIEKAKRRKGGGGWWESARKNRDK
jgi:hypothetical protein